MIFGKPLPFSDALRELEAKGLLPTELSSAEIREQYDAELRARSLFSARTNNAGYLADIGAQIRALLSGETNMSTARAQLQDALDGLGYDPKQGGLDTVAAPAERGSLRDLSSDKRLNLLLETNVRQVANFAAKKKGETDFALFAFPALELVRLYPRRVERGSRVGQDGVIVPDPENSWQNRWKKAGGTVYGGRMIAPKDSPVWDQLGSSQLFNDGLDQPYAPFAFNSGMGTREVAREDAIALGVIQPETDIQGSTRSMNEGIEAAADFDADFLKDVQAEIRGALQNRRALRNRRNRAATLLRIVECGMRNGRVSA